MRFLLVAAAVLALSACVHPVPPVSGAFTQFDALPNIAPRHILAQRGGGVEAYAVHPDRVPVRVHTWPGATDYRLSGYPDGPAEYAIITTPAGSALYSMGHWDRPAVDAATLSTRKLRDYFSLHPLHAGDAAWRGLAIQEDGDAHHTGTPDQWRLFATEDGEHWGPMVIRGAPAPVLDVKRIAAGLALRGGDGWHLFRHVGASQGPQGHAADWEPLDLPGLAGALRELRTAGDRMLGGAPRSEGSKLSWFAWTEGGWKPIAQAIPGAPAKPVSVRSIIPDRVIAVRDGAPGFADHYYVRQGAAWKELADVIPGAPKHIGMSRAFAGNRALLLVSAPTAEHPEPALGAWQLDDGQWKPMTAIGLSPGAWDVVPQGNYAFALRTGTTPAPRYRRYDWIWLVERDHAWVPLERLVPPDVVGFHEARLDAAANAAEIFIEHDKADRPAVEQRILLWDGNRFVPLEQVFHATWTAASLVISDNPEDIVRIDDTTGAEHFLYHQGKTWVDLAAQLGR